MTATVPPRWSWWCLLPTAYGRCYGCRRPWWRRVVPVVVTPGTTEARQRLGLSATEWHQRGYAYEGTGGQFALCRRCWNRRDLILRLLAHRWVCRHVHRYPPNGRVEMDVAAEILRDWADNNAAIPDGVAAALPEVHREKD